MTQPPRSVGATACGALLPAALLLLLSPAAAPQLPEPATGSAVFGDAACFPGVTTTALAADLNADGLDELVTGTFELSVGVNNGFGAFRLLQNDEVADPHFQHLAAVDLDGDGFRDVIATSTASGGRLWVFRGDGTGHLSLGVQRAVPAAAEVDFADFDLDGLLDVAVGHDAPGADFHVLHGAIGGGLNAPTAYGNTAGDSPWIAAGDWNLDGAPDAFVDVPGGLAYWVNDGTGHLTEGSADFDQRDIGGPVRFTDLDADGVPELLHARWSPTHALIVQENDGLGGFGGSTEWSMGSAPEPALTTLHVERAPIDGFPDVLYAGGGRVFVCDNTTGGIDERQSLTGTHEVSLGDLDGDGNADLVERANKGARVRYRLPGDAFSTLQVSDLDSGAGGPSWPYRLLAAQLDGDAAPEFLIADRGAPRVHVAEVGADLQLEVVDSFATVGNLVTHFELADVDGLATPDLVIAHDGPTGVAWLTVHPGDGFGGFGTPVTTEVGGRLLSLVDVDLDGTLDAVTFRGTRSFGYRVGTWFGDGAGGFSAGPELPLPDADGRAGRVADLTGDGLPDLVLTLEDGALPAGASLAVHPGDGAGNWGAPLAAVPPTHVAFQPELGDFDGDGDLDVVTPTIGLGEGRVALFLNDGAGQLTRSVIAGYHTDIPHGLLVADIDQDNRLDVVHGSSDDALVVLRGDGTGGFESPTGHAGVHGGQPGALLSVDVDLDGKRDLVQLSTASSKKEAAVLRRVGFAGQAWAAVGGGVPGGAGQPTGLASGFPKVGKLITLRVKRGPPVTNGYLVVGIDTLELAFKGGHMVPVLDLVFFLPKSTPDGELTLEYAWTLGLPEDFDIWMQAWFPDPSAFRGFAATGGYRLRVP